MNLVLRTKFVGNIWIHINLFKGPPQCRLSNFISNLQPSKYYTEALPTARKWWSYEWFAEFKINVKITAANVMVGGIYTLVVLKIIYYTIITVKISYKASWKFTFNHSVWEYFFIHSFKQIFYFTIYLIHSPFNLIHYHSIQIYFPFYLMNFSFYLRNLSILCRKFYFSQIFFFSL